MAKVGNEVKLILRLAWEQSQNHAIQLQGANIKGSYLDGFAHGLEAYAQLLQGIVSNLETKPPLS